MRLRSCHSWWAPVRFLADERPRHHLQRAERGIAPLALDLRQPDERPHRATIEVRDLRALGDHAAAGELFFPRRRNPARGVAVGDDRRDPEALVAAPLDPPPRREAQEAMDELR